MNTAQITFIIPIYNGEKYLHQCLDSIRFQTYTDWVCILVNDGSQDNSGNICDEYAANDSRFKVIHKVNGGVSSARNVGISHAQTKWITFVDSDDIIADDYLDVVNPILSEGKYEVITISAERITDGGDKYPYTSYCDEEIPVDIFVKGRLDHYISWGYFFNLEIIKRNKLKFEESLSMSEDAVFIMGYFQFVSSVYTMSSKKYYYRINNESVTQNGMSYQKLLNSYNASLLIHNLKKNELLPLDVIDHAVRYQLIMFFYFIRMTEIIGIDYSDLQKKVIFIYRITTKKERPDFLFIASCSVKLYKCSFSTLCRIKRNFLRIKRIINFVIYECSICNKRLPV